MNTSMKWAIALGAVSFALTLWLLRSTPGDPPGEPAPQPSAVRSVPEPKPPRDTARELPSDFASAVSAAERLGATPEGLKYQEEASPTLSTALQQRLASCLSDSSPLGQAPFTIVVGVSPDGVVISTWAAPETPLASCILRRLAGASLPPPPIADVWLAANIRPDASASGAEPER